MYSGYVETVMHNTYEQAMLDDAQIIDTTLLPPEYMPLYYSPNPWNKFAAIEEDFIVIAEFSELEGPKPLICIPNNSSRNDGFDLNAFVLKIMSVDHQSMTPKFCMPQDAQVVLDESKDGVYAYVHHFTLHDSQARGFVRPFCMAYVTPDSRKIMTFYEDIRRLFQQVSKNFKYGNLKLFYKDMKHYVADLEFTKAQLKEFRRKPKKPVGQMSKDELVLNESCDRSIENVLHEIKEIIGVIYPLLDEDIRLSRKFKVIEERASLRERTTSKASFTESSSFDGDNSHIRADIPKGMIKRSSSFNDNNTNVSIMEEYTSYKPSLVKPHRRRFDKTLRTLHELSLWGAKEGINGLRNILRYFRRDTATLLIEKKDSELTDPPSCLLTIGQCVIINFYSNEGGDSGSTWGLKDGSPERSAFSPEKLARWLSTDTLESFKSAESFFSVQDCDFAKTTQSSYEPKFVAAGNPCSEQRRRSLSGTGDSFEIVSTPSDEDIFVEASSSFTNQHDLNEAIKASEHPVNEECLCDEEPSLGVSDSAYSDNFHHVGKKIKIPVISSAEHVNNLESSSPGYGILKFINTHSYSHHLFASMLMGRPVIVMGKLEKDVKDALTTLGLFVPGYSSRRKTVVLSHNQPLKITDLSKLTLIGLIKPEKKTAEYLVPESIKRYVTVLDLDKRNLLSPEYEGGVLKKVLKQKKVFGSDEAYLAYIHCVLLDLASKAFIFYHWMVRESANGLSESIEQIPSFLNQSNKFADLTKAYTLNRDNDLQQVKFMTKLDVKNGDIPIVKYFAEIIQMQQTDDFYTDKLTGLPDKPAPSVRLDYRQTNLFKS